MKIHPQYITDAKGETTAVILPLAECETLVEDLEDFAAIAERKVEPTIPLEIALKQIGL